jgi:hypothetical protein
LDFFLHVFPTAGAMLFNRLSRSPDKKRNTNLRRLVVGSLVAAAVLRVVPMVLRMAGIGQIEQ